MSPPTARTAVRTAPRPAASSRPAAQSVAAIPRPPKRLEGSPRRGDRLGLRLVLAGLALAAPGAGMLWLVLGSGWLAVDRVVVAGAPVRVTTDQLAAAAAVVPGTPMVRIDVEGIRARVSALPAVATVDVERVWPSTLRLRVVERVPVAAVPGPAGVVLVDAGGVAVATVPARPAGVVDLRVATPSAQDPSTRAALDVLLSLPAPLRARVSRLAAASPSAVTLTLTGGATVVWGGPDDSARKAAVLGTLLRRPAATYDVSAADVATVR